MKEMCIAIKTIKMVLRKIQYLLHLHYLPFINAKKRMRMNFGQLF